MIKSKNIILLIFSLLVSNYLWAQSVSSVSGKVVDAKTQQPIEFVNISLQGKSAGTTTDQSGSFQLKVSSDETLKVVFSHINYIKQELSVEDIEKSNNVIALSPKAEVLENIIVSASLYEQSKCAIPKATNIISQRNIKNNFNSNLIDVLSTTPGFTQVWEYHSPIILRGMNSNRLLIMKNGSRRIGTFPGGYFGQDMNIYNLKKIEIVKGPGSVIYGSGAISGIINVIGFEPFGKDESKVNILSGYGSNNNEFLEVVNACYKKENYGLQVNGKFRKTGDFVYGNGETANNSDVEDRDLSLSAGFRLSPTQTLKLNADYHYGDWGKPRGFNGSTKAFTKIRNEENNLHSDINYTFKPQGMLEQISVNLYIDNSKRDYYKSKYSNFGVLTECERTKYSSIYGGGRAFAVLNVTEKSKLTVGTDGYIFDIDMPVETLEPYQAPYDKMTYYGSGMQNIGAFIRDETNFGEKVKIVAGIRYDYAKVIPGECPADSVVQDDETRPAFSGNVGAVYSINSQTHISANIGRAFRLPIAQEMFTETNTCAGVSVGNPELEPEYSWNFDLGIRGYLSENHLNYDLALFYNNLDNYIKKVPSTEENIDFTYENTDAVIYGGELSASYRFDNILKAGNTLNAFLGASYVYGIDKAGEEDVPLFGIPPFKTTLDLNYRGLLNKFCITGYYVKFQSEYAAQQDRVASVPEGTDPGPWGYEACDAHTTFNFSIGLNSNALPFHPKLRFTIKNLLDNDYQPFGSYIPAMGRNFKTTLIFAID